MALKRNDVAREEDCRDAVAAGRRETKGGGGVRVKTSRTARGHSETTGTGKGREAGNGRGTGRSAAGMANRGRHAQTGYCTQARALQTLGTVFLARRGC